MTVPSAHNIRSAQSAWDTLQHFDKQAGDEEEDIYTSITDLLADLLHMLRIRGFERDAESCVYAMGDCLARAEEHFSAEVENETDPDNPEND